MLKKIELFDKLAFGKNNNSRPAFEKNNSNGKFDKLGSNSVEHDKKLKRLKGLKLCKSQKLKSEKLAKSKKPSKRKNSLNFGIKKARSNFLISGAKTAFNHLWLVFTKALIL